MLHKNGLSTNPEVIAELGPGDSLGIGLAALISGADKYYTLDIKKYATNKNNIKVFDELVNLFIKREKIPNEAEFPYIKPFLESCEFPQHILTNKRLNEALNPIRIESIRDVLWNPDDNNKGDIRIAYFVPWYNPDIIREASVDLVYSQAVLEHVDGLINTYETLYHWLKPGGVVSNQIDFHCHGLSRVWNSHWTYSDFVWKLIRGKRIYFLNREPHSTHINLLKNFGFRVICDIKIKDASEIQRKQLASRFKNISDDDLTTSRAFIQAVKESG